MALAIALRDQRHLFPVHGAPVVAGSTIPDHDRNRVGSWVSASRGREPYYERELILFAATAFCPRGG